MGRDLLVVAADEPDTASDQGVQDRQVAVPAHTENDLDPERLEGLGDRVCASELCHVRAPVAAAIFISTSPAASSVFSTSTSV